MGRKDHWRSTTNITSEKLVQPVWRVTQHLEDFSTERFMEELGLDHKTRKEFRRVMEMDREEGGGRDGGSHLEQHPGEVQKT